MITLFFLCLIYTIVGTLVFKSKYGHYSFYDEPFQIWTFVLFLTYVLCMILGMFLIVRFLP